MKHKHHNLIVAWAKGAEIEFYDGYEWVSTNGQPTWHVDNQYRIKPESKPENKLGVKNVYKSI